VVACCAAAQSLTACEMPLLEPHSPEQHHSIMLAWNNGIDVPFHAVLWRPECQPSDN
jgi:hypothetical protein